MNDARFFKRKLAMLQELLAEKKYDSALAQLEGLLARWPGNPQLHVLWATTVQLQESPAHTLEEAKRALYSAASLDEGSPAAAIELGHFLDAVEDNPQAAAKAYSSAIGSARRLLIDALLGRARALLQLGKREEAIACLMESLYLTNRQKPHAVSGVLCQDANGASLRFP